MGDMDDVGEDDDEVDDDKKDEEADLWKKQHQQDW